MAPITPVWTGVISNSSIWHLRGVFNGQSRVHIQSPLQCVQPEGLSWEACCLPVSLSPPLLPTCFLQNHVDCSHSFSCLLTSGLSELGPQEASAGGQGRGECRSALLPCYEPAWADWRSLLPSRWPFLHNSPLEVEVHGQALLRLPFPVLWRQPRSPPSSWSRWGPPPHTNSSWGRVGPWCPFLSPDVLSLPGWQRELDLFQGKC